MLIKDIVKGIDIEDVKNYNDELEVKSIYDNSLNVENNSLFVCIKGGKYDGHNFAKEAVNKGAIVLLVEDFIEEINIVQIKCNNTRKALAICCSNFYRDIINNLKFIGVTGTNGKTTVTYMLQNILSSNYKVGLIGTTGVYYSNKKIETNLTTPDCLELYKIFNIMYDSGIDTIIMEVSAHAIALYKVFNIKFDIGIFTNLTHDHLDFFGDIESYYSVKAGFIMDQCNNKIINVDDKYGRQLYTICCEPKYSYALKSPADIFAVDIFNGKNGSQYVINAKDELYDIECKIPNDYNIANSLAAIYAGRLMGIDMCKCALYLSKLEDIPGRMKIINANGFDVVVDYAHTPDGLEKLLLNLKELGYSNIVTVFGSCGYRDSLKRPIMGDVVSNLSDFCYITNDNPRFENPIDIAMDIAKGCKNLNYEIVLDRELAIKKAIDKVLKNGVVVCCGKSSDKYQDIRGKKIEFDELKIIKKLISIISK